MSSTLGEKLRQARDERGLTISEIAEQTRISALYLAAIENDDQEQVRTLCRRYTTEVCCFGTQPGEIDTLVMGCTHYPFAAEVFRELLGPEIQLVETGVPVARQTRSLLQTKGLLNPAGAGQVRFHTSGNTDALELAAARWLGL